MTDLSKHVTGDNNEQKSAASKENKTETDPQREWTQSCSHSVCPTCRSRSGSTTFVDAKPLVSVTTFACPFPQKLVMVHKIDHYVLGVRGLGRKWFSIAASNHCLAVRLLHDAPAPILDTIRYD